MLSPHVFTSYCTSYSLLTLFHWSCGTHAELSSSFLPCPSWEERVLWKRGYEDVLKWRTSIMCGIFCCTLWLCADEWLDSLSSLIITQQGVCVFSCCFDSCTVFLSGRGLFTVFPVGHSCWGAWISTNCSSLSAVWTEQLWKGNQGLWDNAANHQVKR